MSARVDHAEAALRLLGDAEKLGGPSCERLLQAAQVQATLALADQQRAANIIAVADATYVSSETERKVWAAVGPILEVDLSFGADS